MVAVLVAAAALTGLVSTSPAFAAERKPALMLLNSLPVTPEHQVGYERELFADWYDANRSGCDSREDVLIAERLTGRVVDCTVVGGRWISAYDGVVTRDASSFDIDHRVSGAATASGILT